MTKLSLEGRLPNSRMRRLKPTSTPLYLTSTCIALWGAGAFLDDDARAALARGKEQLAKARSEVGEQHFAKEAPLNAPVPPSVSADVDITGPGSHSPSPVKVTTEITSTQGGDEGEESAEAQAYEVDIRKPASPGNSTVNLAQVDCLFAPHEFDELFDYFFNLNEPLSPFFTGDTNIFGFSSSVAKTPSATQTSPPPAVPPPFPQITPISQPGSQEELIGALQGLDDPIASQERKDEGLEGGDKSPEHTIFDDVKLAALVTPGSESSSRRRRKRTTSKKKRKSILVSEEEAKVDPAVTLSPSSPTLPSRPEKLPIRSGEGSKGGGKKK